MADADFGYVGGALYATDSTITLGADDGSCAASQISGAVAPEGAALSFFDTSDAPDDVGLSAVGLQLSQLNPNSEDGDDRRITQDEAIYASTSIPVDVAWATDPVAAVGQRGAVARAEP